MKVNNVYVATFSGYYLTGHMAIITDTKRKAFNRAKKKIESMGLLRKNEDFSMDNVVMIDTNIEDTHIIETGDY